MIAFIQDSIWGIQYIRDFYYLFMDFIFFTIYYLAQVIQSQNYIYLVKEIIF